MSPFPCRHCLPGLSVRGRDQEMDFSVLHSDAGSKARVGRLKLPHGDVQTPAFMPVGTQATVKTLTPAELEEAGAQMIVCNTYHLYLRPGHDRVRALGGISRFMGWHHPILTDSGGFQVYSLAVLALVGDEGVEFQSHLDGSRHFFSPERTVEIQEALGSDIAMCLDECPPYPVTEEQARDAAARTTLWARRCKAAAQAATNLFGIVQGATYAHLRRQSASELAELDFPGYALGGLCLGEPSELTYELVSAAGEVLPGTKPLYLMGAGYPEDIIAAVRLGVDLFDCVLPTRNGRTGSAFTSTGQLAIRNARYADDRLPLDRACDCYTCRSFSRAYLRHMFIAGEALGPRLLALHNVWFYQKLMQGLRSAIERQEFDTWSRSFLDRYCSGAEEKVRVSERNGMSPKDAHE